MSMEPDVCVAQVRRQAKSMTGVGPDVLYMMISLYHKIVNTTGKGMLECRDNYWTFCNGTHEVIIIFLLSLHGIVLTYLPS